MNRPTKLFVFTALLALSCRSHAVVPEECDLEQCLGEAMSLHFDQALPQRIHQEVEMLELVVVGDRASFTAVSYVPSDTFTRSVEQLDELKEAVTRASEEWACTEPSGYAAMFIENGGTVVINVSHIDYAPMTRTAITQCP